MYTGSILILYRVYKNHHITNVSLFQSEQQLESLREEVEDLKNKVFTGANKYFLALARD